MYKLMKLDEVGNDEVGKVDQIAEFGAFLNFGSPDGLTRVSRVMDDYMDADIINGRLRNSKRILRVAGDEKMKKLAEAYYGH